MEMNKEERVEVQEDAVIKAIKEEYEAKIVALKKEHEEEIARVKKECEEQEVRRIRAIVSGRQEQPLEEEEPDEELSFFDEAMEECRNYLKER